MMAINIAYKNVNENFVSGCEISSISVLSVFFVVCCVNVIQFYVSSDIEKWTVVASIPYYSYHDG